MFSINIHQRAVETQILAYYRVESSFAVLTESWTRQDTGSIGKAHSSAFPEQSPRVHGDIMGGVRSSNTSSDGTPDVIDWIEVK